jgi:hypothetical protein
MNEEDVLNKLERKTNPNSLTKRYGVFGLSLGQDLYEQLDKYCSNKILLKQV